MNKFGGVGCCWEVFVLGVRLSPRARAAVTEGLGVLKAPARDILSPKDRGQSGLWSSTELRVLAQSHNSLCSVTKPAGGRASVSPLVKHVGMSLGCSWEPSAGRESWGAAATLPLCCLCVSLNLQLHPMRMEKTRSALPMEGKSWNNTARAGPAGLAAELCGAIGSPWSSLGKLGGLSLILPLWDGEGFGSTPPSGRPS